jgi:hypothetical protein
MIVGFGLSIVTIVSFLTWGGTPSVEWFTVIASMTFAVLLGYDSYRKNMRKRLSSVSRGQSLKRFFVNHRRI